jgi:hypothetical protein
MIVQSTHCEILLTWFPSVPAKSPSQLAQYIAVSPEPPSKKRTQGTLTSHFVSRRIPQPSPSPSPEPVYITSKSGRKIKVKVNKPIILDSDDEEDFVVKKPHKSKQPLDSEDDVFSMDEVPESEDQSASSEAETVDSVESEQIDTDDEQPSGKRSKAKVSSGVKIAGQKATKESYKCVIKPCHLDIAPREEENEGDDLAPISKLDTIFGDIIDRVFDHVADLMGDKKHRKIRVATMCSGTESPILALGMFAKAIKERGLGNFEVEHVFSCEIEPYKQAYIERNFKPPILFRDIRELGGDTA